MSPPNPGPVRLRLIQGGRSSGAGDKPSFGPKREPLEEAPVPLHEMRRKNRLWLAERYWELESRKKSEADERRIEVTSRNPIALKNFIREKKIDFKREAADFAKKMRDADYLDDRKDVFEKLAMISSDAGMCGKKASIAALKALLMESLIHNTKEAKEALASIGYKLEEIPRAEIMALYTNILFRWLVGRWKRAMADIERKFEMDRPEMADE